MREYAGIESHGTTMAMCTTIVETQRDDDAEDGEGWLDLSDQHQMQNRQFTAYHSSDDYGW